MVHSGVRADALSVGDLQKRPEKPEQPKDKVGRKQMHRLGYPGESQVIERGSKQHFKDDQPEKRVQGRTGRGMPQGALVDAPQKPAAEPQDYPRKRPVYIKDPWNGIDPLVAA